MMGPDIEEVAERVADSLIEHDTVDFHFDEEQLTVLKAAIRSEYHAMRLEGFVGDS